MLPPYPVVAVNEEYAPEDRTSERRRRGGVHSSGRRGLRVLRTAIVSEPIAPEELLAGLLHPPEDGACLLFLGVVRDHNQGRVVTGLGLRGVPGDGREDAGRHR